MQGMSFVTAILLMYMSEEEALWKLTALLWPFCQLCKCRSEVVAYNPFLQPHALYLGSMLQGLYWLLLLFPAWYCRRWATCKAWAL